MESTGTERAQQSEPPTFRGSGNGGSQGHSTGGSNSAASGLVGDDVDRRQGAKQFGAFISYSHRADQDLAIALRRGLHQLAKPWYRPRAVKVFLDNASLSTNPALWDSLCASLERSDKLIVLCSPDSARSEWVGKEISQFLTTSSVDSILPVLTSGELVWDPVANDFDMQASTAASPAMHGIFEQEPRHLDLRWTHEASVTAGLSLRNPRFLEAVADLAAPIRGVPKDELVGEDIAQHKRTRLIARAGVSALTVLLVVSVMAGVLARSNAVRANRNAARAEQRRIESDARRLSSDASRLEGPGDLAFLLAASAHRLDPTVASVDALFEVADRYPQLESVTHLGEPVLAFDRNPSTGDLVVGSGSAAAPTTGTPTTGTPTTGTPTTGTPTTGTPTTGSRTTSTTRAGAETGAIPAPKVSAVSLFDSTGNRKAGPVSVDGIVRRIFFMKDTVVVTTTSTMKLLDPKSLGDVGEFESPDGFYSTAAISTADGGLVAGCSDRGIFVIRTTDSEPTQLTTNGEYATAISILSDGNVVALTVKPGESMFEVVRFKRTSIDGDWQETWRVPALRIATAMTVDEDLGAVFVGSASGDVVSLALTSGRPLVRYTNVIDSRITSIAVSGALLGVSDGVGRVWIRNASEDTGEFRWQAHQGAATTLVVIPASDGKGVRFASGGTDGSIVIHSIEPTYPFTQRIPLPDQATSVRVDPASNRVWVGTPNAVLQRELPADPAQITTTTPWNETDIGSVASAIEPIADNAVAVGDYRGRISLIRDGKIVSSASTKSDTVFALAWNPALSQLYAITAANELAVFTLVDDKLISGEPLSTESTGQLIAVSANGRRVAFSTVRGVEVIDPSSRSVVRTFPASFENYAEAFALDETGDRLALGDIGRINVFAIESGSQLSETPLASDPVSVSFANNPAERGINGLLLLVLRDHSAVRVEAATGRTAGRIRTTNLAAVDATSEDLQWFADTSGGLGYVATANERTLYLSDLTTEGVIAESCLRFKRLLSPTERLRFALTDGMAPCSAVRDATTVSLTPNKD